VLCLTLDVTSNALKHVIQVLPKLPVPLLRWMLKLSIALKLPAALPQMLFPLANLFKPTFNANST
tara:strand:- start:50 stop:244 length:195 start_codon:yes stop_codon:yes gene_type:complete